MARTVTVGKWGVSLDETPEGVTLRIYQRGSYGVRGTLDGKRYASVEDAEADALKAGYLKAV